MEYVPRLLPCPEDSEIAAGEIGGRANHVASCSFAWTQIRHAGPLTSFFGVRFYVATDSSESVLCVSCGFCEKC